MQACSARSSKHSSPAGGFSPDLDKWQRKLTKPLAMKSKPAMLTE
jgi:hypothetical protein